MPTVEAIGALLVGGLVRVTAAAGTGAGKGTLVGLTLKGVLEGARLIVGLAVTLRGVAEGRGGLVASKNIGDGALLGAVVIRADGRSC